MQKDLIKHLLDGELARQQSELELIASENYVSPQVMQAYANVFTNKYSEGYPGKRYYGGQERVDRMELLTQYRALAIFNLVDWRGLKRPKGVPQSGKMMGEVWRGLNIDEGLRQKFEGVDRDFEKAVGDTNFKISELVKLMNGIEEEAWWWVNVQPLSWSPANLAVYLGLLKPGDTILWMDLNAWGHLSHGFKLNASGVFYNAVFYGVDRQTHLIDRGQVEQMALEHQPKMIVAWYSAYPRRLDWSKFAQIADKVEQVHWYRPYLMADIAHIAWLIAWEALDSPFPWFDVVTTTTHKTLRWPRWALIYFRRGLKRPKGVPVRHGTGPQSGKRKAEVWREEDLKSSINRGVFPGVQWWPHDHIVLAKAVAFGEILSNDKTDRKKYVNQILQNAKVLAESLSARWWKLITGGTDNHLILVDVAWSFPELKIDGKIAEKTLEKIGLSINKNSIPFDTNPPLRPSGIRLGTPALTTRGFGTAEFEQIWAIIDQALKNWQDEDLLEELHSQVANLAQKFPLPY